MAIEWSALFPLTTVAFAIDAAGFAFSRQNWHSGSMNFPQNINPTEFHNTYRLAPDLWREAVYEVLAKHDLQLNFCEAFQDGSNLLAADDHTVVKIFPPFHRNQWESEWRALKRLSDAGVAIPIPKLIASGERADQWTYAVMTRVNGVTLDSIWPQCSRQEKAKLLGEVGQIMAQVHGIPVGDLADLDPEWNAFLKEQRHECIARHRRLGMPDWFLSDVERFLSQSVSLADLGPHVILTGEYTPFNLLVDRGPAGWHISGMIDFGDVMIGPPEYDFLGPCLFSAEGDEYLIESLFAGYGSPSPRSHTDLRRKLMLVAVLHRYSNLNAQIRIENWKNRVNSLAELENLIFAVNA